MSREHRPLTKASMLPDETLQAAVGRIAIRHGQLDHILRLLLESIDDITLEEARARTKSMTSGLLCQCVRRAAKAALGEADAFRQLDALLTAAAGATEQRNRLMHGLCTIGQDDGQRHRARADRPGQVPTLPELDALAERLDVVAEQLDHARRHGFLNEALQQRARGKGA
jgi:hypothetical protein